MRLFSLACFVLVCLCVLIAPGSAAPKGKPGAAKPKKKEKKEFHEVVDVMLDVADRTCMKLGRLVKRKKFSAERRCDLLKFCIEDLAGMFDSMVQELDVTQQHMVDSAMRPGYYMQLSAHMKDIAKMVLAQKQPTEKNVTQELTRKMSQWILNVATQNTGSSTSNGLEHLSREALKNLKAQGINLPGMGILDDDDNEEEHVIHGEDHEWATQRSLDPEDEADEVNDDD
jgi:hypothetical protein